jgi:hypothetical protein
MLQVAVRGGVAISSGGTIRFWHWISMQHIRTLSRNLR